MLAVAAGVALLALRWLLVQTRTDRLGRLVLDEDERGASYVDARGLGSALADHVASLSGVRRARASLIDAHGGAQLRLTVVVVDEDRHVNELRTGALSALSALSDARHVLEDSGLRS